MKCRSSTQEAKVKAMYKITMRCSGRDAHEINPVGEELDFVRIAYTNDANVADYYKDRIGLISIEEVEDQE